MVRLKANTVMHCQVIVEFQFHYGTIKSVYRTSYPAPHCLHFNSIMVRLKEKPVKNPLN